MINNPLNVAILVFDDAEVLDFAGPYEVFTVAKEFTKPPAFHVYCVGIGASPVLARGKFAVSPRYTIDDSPQADILVIPGGFGTRPLLKHERLVSWIREQAGKVQWLLSVCTGALLLAKAGLLENRPATTHHGALDHLKLLSPTTTIVKDRRFVQSGERIFTAGGISAGIDLALHMVEKLAGKEARQAVAAEMEYGNPGESHGPF